MVRCPAEIYRPSARDYRGMGELSYPFHDRTVLVTYCGRICIFKKKINLSTSLAGQAVGIKEVDDGIWLVSFMDYDLGYIDLEEKTLQPLDNPFGPRVYAVSGGRRNTSTEYIRRCPPVKSCSGSGIQFSSDSV
jgi:hypothetical protein